MDVTNIYILIGYFTPTIIHTGEFNLNFNSDKILHSDYI